MQIIYLPTTLALMLCFIVWPVLQIVATIICLYIPDKVFSSQSFFFRTYKFEKDGRIYDTLFRIKRWKHLLPDGGVIFKKRGFSKKHLDNFSVDTLNRFLIESARGELTHWIAIFPFWTFGFFAPKQVIWYMLIYSLIVNLPCIIAQRYNRPRVVRLLNNIYKKGNY